MKQEDDKVQLEPENYESGRRQSTERTRKL